MLKVTKRHRSRDEGHSEASVTVRDLLSACTTGISPSDHVALQAMVYDYFIKYNLTFK